MWQCRSVLTSYWGTRSYYRVPGQSSLVPTSCIPSSQLDTSYLGSMLKRVVLCRIPRTALVYMYLYMSTCSTCIGHVGCVVGQWVQVRTSTHDFLKSESVLSPTLYRIIIRRGRAWKIAWYPGLPLLWEK